MLIEKLQFEKQVCIISFNGFHFNKNENYDYLEINQKI